MKRVARAALIFSLSASGSTVALAMSGGGGHGGASTGSHGSVKPGNGGGPGHNQVAGQGARIPVTPPGILLKRIQTPRS